MRRAILIIAAVVVVIVVALVFLFFNLEGLVNKNKDKVLSKAEAQIGREITLGEIGLSFKGGLGVVLNNVALSDDSSFSNEPLVSARTLQVNAKLLPLLHKEFEVKRVILRDPVFNVVRNEAGVLNVTTLVDTTGQKGKAGGKNAAAASLVVSLINIENGEIHFTDKAQGVKLDVTDIDSKVTDFEMNRPISLELAAAVLSDEQNLSVEGTFGPVGEDPAATPVDAAVRLAPIDIDRLRAMVPAMQKSTPPDLSVSGTIELEMRALGTAGDMTLSLATDGSNLTIALPGKFQKASGVPLSAASDIRVAGEKATLSNIDVRVHSLEATGEGEYTMGDKPAIRLDIRSKPTSLAGWNEILPAMSDYDVGGSMTVAARIEGPLAPGVKPNVSGALTLSDVKAALPEAPKPISALNSQVSFTDNSAKVTDTSLRVGGSRVEVDATVSSFEPLEAQYQVSSPELALDDVRMPPDPKTAKGATRRPTKNPEVIRNLSVDGTLKVVGEKPQGAGKIRSSSGSVADIEYQDLSGNYSLAGERLDFTNLVVQLLDGSVEGSGSVTTGENPAFEFKTQAKGINVVGALQMIPTITQTHLRGTSNFNLTVSGKGKEWADIQPTVSGDGFAELFNGAIVDVNLMSEIINNITKNSGLTNLVSQRVQDKYPKVFKSRDTEFKDLRSTFVIDNGKLLIRNLDLNSDQYGLRGTGALDFNRGLSMDVSLTLSSALTADITKDFKPASYLTNSKGQIQVPFTVEGVLPNVNARPDQKFVNDVAQKALMGEGKSLLDNLLKKKKP